MAKVIGRQKAKGRTGNEDDGKGDPAGDCAGSTRGEGERNRQGKGATEEAEEGERRGRGGGRRKEASARASQAFPLNAKGPAGAQRGPTERRVGAP